MIKPLLIWLKQRYCNHFIDTVDLKRRPDGMVECPCYKCGKVLVAEYGLAIQAYWGKKPESK